MFVFAFMWSWELFQTFANCDANTHKIHMMPTVSNNIDFSNVTEQMPIGLQDYVAEYMYCKFKCKTDVMLPLKIQHVMCNANR